MLKKEHEILLQFVKEPWKKLTFKEVKILSEKKSESYVYNSLKKFVAGNILKKEKIGNTILYFLNLESTKARIYAGFILEDLAWRQKRIPYGDLENILDKMPTSFYAMVVSGSYASGIQKKDSDIDVIFIISEDTEPKKIYAELSNCCEMNIPLIHLHVFKESEFAAMLADKKANYGKEIAKNNLLICGAESYCKIMNEAIKNGFNG